jgi:hypothetical protein
MEERPLQSHLRTTLWRTAAHVDQGVTVIDPDRTGTHMVAFASLISPLWLHTLSDAATTALPIMGVLWLVIQCAGYLYTTFWKAEAAVKKDIKE